MPDTTDPPRPRLERALRLPLPPPWRLPAVRNRILIITFAVGSFVTLGHQGLDERVPPAAWIVVHTLLPVLVFALGARAAGAPRIDGRLLRRGALTVVTVAIAFTVVNDYLILSPAAQWASNLVVPAVVSTLGAWSRPRA